MLQNRGRSMRVRLDEDTLKAIAEATEGKYFNASSGKDLQSIYDNLRKEFVLRTQLTEITALFTAAALALSVVATGLSILWFNRLL